MAFVSSYLLIILIQTFLNNSIDRNIMADLLIISLVVFGGVVLFILFFKLLKSVLKSVVIAVVFILLFLLILRVAGVPTTDLLNQTNTTNMTNTSNESTMNMAGQAIHVVEHAGNALLGKVTETLADTAKNSIDEAVS